MSCTECTLYKDSGVNCIQGDGPEDADILIVGEAPGRDEERTGFAFIGDAGAYLREEIMPMAGIQDAGVRMDYAVRCRPKKDKSPTIHHIHACRTHIEEAIGRQNPKVIVPLGNVGLASILDFFYNDSSKSGGKVSGISYWRGKKLWSQEFSCWVVPTYHPSFLRTNNSSMYDRQVVDDLSLANKLAHQERPVKRMPEAVWVRDVETAWRALEEMKASEAFAYDIETGGDARKYIIGFSMACSHDIGYYFTQDFVDNHPDFKAAVYAFLEQDKPLKIMHNGAFELRVHRMNNIPLSDQYRDTMIMAHMVDENFPKGLKPNAWRYTAMGGYDRPLDKWKKENGVKVDYSYIPTEILAPYGAYDSIATYTLYHRLKKKMKREHLTPLFDRVVMPVRRVMSMAEHVGLPVRVDRAKEIHEACGKARGLLQEKIFEEAGQEFNLNSTPQKRHILFDKMGFEPLKETKTGYSTDADTIDDIATRQGGTIGLYMSDLSYLSTMDNTHISQAIKFAWEDGKVHTSYNLTGTVTGRASAARPSIHNTPNDSLIRTLYTASPGNKLVDADLKTAELVYLAAVSGEETFLEAFANGYDIHSETAKKVFNLGDQEPTKEQRRASKSINFGLVYGKTAYGLAKDWGVSVEEAQEFIDAYFEQFPKIERYMNEVMQYAKINGYVTSLFKRKRRLPEAMSDIDYIASRASRQALNSPIQSGAADYTYIGLVRWYNMIKEAGLRSEVVHTVHDCGISDTPEDEVEIVKPMVVKAFETPVKALPVRMRIEYAVEDYWGEGGESRLQDILASVGVKV